MSLVDLYTGDRPNHQRFTCEHYDALPGGKRCRHYVKGGACARAEELMCVEWLKANEPGQVPAPEPVPTVATDLFGHPLREPARPAPAPSAPSKRPSVALPPPKPEPDDRSPLRGITTEDIEGFKQLGVEICLESKDYGELWLVPEYTGHDRRELTPEHAATISRVLEAFPGSRVVSFRKSTKKQKEADV